MVVIMHVSAVTHYQVLGQVMCKHCRSSTNHTVFHVSLFSCSAQYGIDRDCMSSLPEKAKRIHFFFTNVIHHQSQFQ